MFFHRHALRQGIAVVAVTALIGTSTAFAAVGSLPGDTLYPVKIHVNERVETLLAVTAEARVGVVADQALRRIGEAETLAHQGRLTEDVTKEIETHFRGKAEEVSVRTQFLRESKKSDDADSVEQRFSDDLERHYQSFIELEQGDGSTTPGVSEVKQVIERDRDSRRRKREERKREELRAADESHDSDLEDKSGHEGESDD
jgi:hypothetical protein